MSASVILALASTFSTAVTGAMKISFGATPLVAVATMRALSGERLSRATSAEATTSAAAPSLICEALPAVTVPRLAERGRSLPSASSDVSGRGPSSCVTIVSPLRRHGDRHDLVQLSAGPGRCPAMAFQRKRVLIRARDAARFGDVIGLGAHGDVLKRAPQAVVEHRIAHLLVAELPALPGLRKAKTAPGSCSPSRRPRSRWRRRREWPDRPALRPSALSRTFC